MGAKKIVITEPAEEKIVVAVDQPADEPDMSPEPSPAPQSNPTDIDPAEAEDAENLPKENLSDATSSPWPAPKPRVPTRRLSFLGSLLEVSRRWRRVAVLAVVAIIIGLVVGHVLTKPAANPVPKSLQQAVRFPLYYPHSTIGKYRYVADSGNYAGDKLTYSLEAGGPTIRITEQALTVKAPDLHNLQGFSVFQTPVGQAAVGASGDVLNGVLVTGKTLVILNGLGGVSKQDFTQVINSLGV